MFSEPRFRVGVAGQDGFYHVDMVDELNADLCEDDDPYTIDDCPIVHYVGGFETDRDRDSAMTMYILKVTSTQNVLISSTI